MVAGLELARVEQHHASANHRKGVVQLEIVEDGAFGDDILEQRPQVGDILLAVAELVDQAALSFRGRDVKCLVEGAIGGPDAQRRIQNQQGLAHRVDDVLSVVLNIFHEWAWFYHGHPRASFGGSPPEKLLI